MKFKKYVRRWLWIIVWALFSIFVAFITQVLFSIPAKADIFEAAWSAGDILTYVSTVSLGLLALWQAQKIHYDDKENAKFNLALDKYVIK